MKRGDEIRHHPAKNKALVIIPAFNEEGNIERTLQKLFALDLPFDVVVVNDGSSDQTELKAKGTKAFVITLPFNLGIGGAVQAGFQFADRYGYDLAIQVDGDDQHDVGYITELMKPLLSHQADMIIGSRFLPPYIGYRSSFVRRIGIHFFARLISFLTGCKVTDPTSGFRAFNERLIKVFSQYYPQDFPEPEAIVVAKRYHARMLEVPVKMNKRVAGRSSIRYLRTLYYMVKVTFAILLDKLKQKKEMV